MKTRRTTQTAVLLTLAALTAGACLAKDNPVKPDEAGARAATLARFDAALKGDLASLDKLLADDLDYCHSNGDCENKRAYLDSMQAGTMKYRSIVPTIDGAKLIGLVAIVLGHAQVNATRGGSELNMQIGYTSVLVWRDARWQMTSWRAVTLPAGKP